MCLHRRVVPLVFFCAFFKEKVGAERDIKSAPFMLSGNPYLPDPFPETFPRKVRAVFTRGAFAFLVPVVFEFVAVFRFAYFVA